MGDAVNYTHEYRSSDDLPKPYIDEQCIRCICSFWQIQPRLEAFQTLSPASMKYELLRLLTLGNYRRQDDRPDIVRIAVAGFYYASDEDALVCFCCGLTVKGLRYNDKPVEIHCLLSERCNFIQQNHVVNGRIFARTPTEIHIFRRFQYGFRETQELSVNDFEDSQGSMPQTSDHTPSHYIAEVHRELGENADLNLFQNERRLGTNYELQDELRYILQNTRDAEDLTSSMISHDDVMRNLMIYMERVHVTQAQNNTQEASASILQQNRNTENADDDTLGSNETVATSNLRTQKERIEVTQQQNTVQEASPVSIVQQIDYTDCTNDDSLGGDDRDITPTLTTLVQTTNPQNIIIQAYLKDNGAADTTDDDVNDLCNPSSHEENDCDTDQLLNAVGQREELIYDRSGGTAGICQPIQRGMMPPIIQSNRDLLIDKRNMYNALCTASIEQRTSQDRPMYLNLEQCNSRLTTFNSWPLECTLPSEELADAGFFYTGYSDRVRCFQCGIELLQWKNEDEPWIEHVDKSPNCKYVKEIWGSEFVRAVTKDDRDVLRTYKALIKARRLRVLNK